MLRRKRLWIFDKSGMPAWRRWPGGGFYRCYGGVWMFRTPLDWLLRRPGTEVISHGVQHRDTLPPGTPLRGAMDGFGGVVAQDGTSVLFAPT